MQAADIPVKFQLPFAASAGPGFIRTIPVASQIPITPGAASLTDGFPPLTFLPVGSGGIPPFGEDFNGILNQITAWLQWLNAGGPVTFDATFAAAIGGYPEGALLSAVAGGGAYWLNTVDNNSTDPDAGGADWQAVVTEPAAATPKIDGTGAVGTSLKYAREDHVHPDGWCGAATGTANAPILAPPPTLAALSAGVSLSFLATATNTGAVNITVTGIGPLAVRRRGPTGPVALTGSEIVAGNEYTVVCDGTFLQLDSPAQGTAARSNATGNTGKVVSMSGTSLVGNLPAFSDAAGTVVDSGVSPGSITGSGDGVLYQIGLIF